MDLLKIRNMTVTEITLPNKLAKTLQSSRYTGNIMCVLEMDHRLQCNKWFGLERSFGM